VFLALAVMDLIVFPSLAWNCLAFFLPLSVGVLYQGREELCLRLLALIKKFI